MNITKTVFADACFVDTHGVYQPSGMLGALMRTVDRTMTSDYLATLPSRWVIIINSMPLAILRARHGSHSKSILRSRARSGSPEYGSQLRRIRKGLLENTGDGRHHKGRFAAARPIIQIPSNLRRLDQPNAGSRSAQPPRSPPPRQVTRFDADFSQNWIKNREICAVAVG